MLPILSQTLVGGRETGRGRARLPRFPTHEPGFRRPMIPLDERGQPLLLIPALTAPRPAIGADPSEWKAYIDEIHSLEAQILNLMTTLPPIKRVKAAAQLNALHLQERLAWADLNFGLKRKPVPRIVKEAPSVFKEKRDQVRQVAAELSQRALERRGGRPVRIFEPPSPPAITVIEPVNLREALAMRLRKPEGPSFQSIRRFFKVRG